MFVIVFCLLFMPMICPGFVLLFMIVVCFVEWEFPSIQTAHRHGQAHEIVSMHTIVCHNLNIRLFLLRSYWPTRRCPHPFFVYVYVYVS